MFKAIVNFFDVLTLAAAALSTWLMWNTLLQAGGYEPNLQVSFGEAGLGAAGLAASSATALAIVVIPYCIARTLEQARQRRRERD